MEYNGTTYSARNTFIIDPEGKIAKVFLKANFKTNSEDVLAALADLQKSAQKNKLDEEEQDSAGNYIAVSRWSGRLDSNARQQSRFHKGIPH